MSNILKAFINIVNNHQVTIPNMTQGNNRANNMGEGLDLYHSHTRIQVSFTALKIGREQYSSKRNR